MSPRSVGAWAGITSEPGRPSSGRRTLKRGLGVEAVGCSADGCRARRLFTLDTNSSGLGSERRSRPVGDTDEPASDTTDSATGSEPGPRPPFTIPDARPGPEPAHIDYGKDRSHRADRLRQVTSAVALGGSIWVSQYQHVGAWLVRINPVAGQTNLTAGLPATLAPAELAAGSDGSLWVSTLPGATGGETQPNGTVARIDPTSGAVVARADLQIMGMIAPGDGVVWVPADSKLQRLDAATLKVTRTFPVAGEPATQCALSVTQSAATSAAFYLDPDSGEVTARIDLGVDGRLLGNDPVEGTDNCWAIVGPPAGVDPATGGSTLVELGLENTMVETGQSPPVHGDVRVAAGNFWLIAYGTMTAIDPLTLAPLGPTWLLPPDVADPASWTLLGAGGALWWIGPGEALRVGIPIPPTKARGRIAPRPWAGPFVPAAAAFSDLDHGILVGATGNGAGAGVVATTANGGRTWSARLLDTPPLYGVSIRGSKAIASVRCRIDASPACLTSTIGSADVGVSWTTSTDTGLDHAQLASGSVAWATYNPTISYSGVASSRDGGATWTRYPSPCPRGFPIFEPAGISFPTATEGWLTCGGGGAGGSSAKALFRTTNGGRTWTTLFVQSLGAGGVPFGPANDLLLGGDSAQIDFLADGTGWISTGDGLFVTHDGGLGWHLAGFDQGAGGLQVDAMDFLSDDDGVVLVSDLSAPANQISLERTTDAGSIWATMSSWSVGN
jgi:hypothetical protein